MLSSRVATGRDTRVIDLATMCEVARVDGPASASIALAFTLDGARVVTASMDSTALIWSVDEAVAGYVPEAATTSKRRRS